MYFRRPLPHHAMVSRKRRCLYNLLLIALSATTVWYILLSNSSTPIPTTSFPGTSLGDHTVTSGSVAWETNLPLSTLQNVSLNSGPDRITADSAVKQPTVCSSMSLDSPVVQRSIEAWHTFIPAHTHMTNSCWYTTNFIFPFSSSDVINNLISWIDLQHIERKFSKETASRIVHGAFKDGQLTGQFEPKLKRVNPLPWQYFCIPNVYLAGFPKCGTTFLYNVITQHSGVKSPAVKEGHFWRGFVSNSSTELIYQKLQVLHYIFHFKQAAHELLFTYSDKVTSFTIDASASTIFESAKWFDDYQEDSCVIPTLMSHLLPKTKFIIVMRHPVDRLWSDYWYFCELKQLHQQEESDALPFTSSPAEIFHNHTLRVITDFKHCVQEGESELSCLSLARGKACESGRVSLSLYYLHLIRWLSMFPRKQFLFLKMEDFTTDLMYSVMTRVWSFLELSPMTEDQLKREIQLLQSSQDRNENVWMKSDKNQGKFKMWDETRSKLNSFFRPYNEQLAQLLQDDRFLWDS